MSIKYIKDFQFVGAMVPGRSYVDPRFVRLFNVFCIAFPAEQSIQRIYRTMLETFFATGAFDKSLQTAEFSQKLTATAMGVFNAIVSHLPPTPAKFHYIFNLRDLSRITEGVMQATPDKMGTSGALVRLMRHELLRVFNDRLVGDDDKTFVTGRIESAIRDNFAEDAEAAMAEPILYGDFLNYHIVEEERAAGGGDTLRLYEDVADFAAIKPVLEEVLEKYNLVYKQMNLVLFDDCLGHLVRVHRLMRMPRGNALLVGVGGSGKQSITRLAAFTAECDVFSITLTRGYNESLFREDLKTLYGMLTSKQVGLPQQRQHPQLAPAARTAARPPP